MCSCRKHCISLAARWQPASGSWSVLHAEHPLAKRHDSVAHQRSKQRARAEVSASPVAPACRGSSVRASVDACQQGSQLIYHPLGYEPGYETLQLQLTAAKLTVKLNPPT